MAKIYNEIVIDMNPESSTFEETLFEDSFEYSGDLMEMQDEGGQIAEGTRMALAVPYAGMTQWVIHKYTNGEWVETGAKSTKMSNITVPIFDSKYEATIAMKEGLEGGTEYGAPSLTKESFFNPDGTKKHPTEIAWEIKNALPPDSDRAYDDILKEVVDMMPQLEEVEEEEVEFAKEAKERDVYAIQRGVVESGAQSGVGMGGMGTGMRGAVAEQKDVGKKMEFAEQAYAEDIYGLEKEKYREFEENIQSTFFREGGRVPSRKKETFSDILSKLPEAGGS